MAVLLLEETDADVGLGGQDDAETEGVLLVLLAVHGAVEDDLAPLVLAYVDGDVVLDEVYALG